MKKQVTIILMMCSLALAGDISGVVVDSSIGNLVARSVVSVKGTELYAFTDSQGIFHIRREGVESAVLRISSVGHGEESIADLDPKNIRTKLEPEVAVATTIVVKGRGTTRFFTDTPLATSFVSRETIELRRETDLCGFLDNALSFKTGAENISDELQEDLDSGPERDAGYVYGLATPSAITIRFEEGI